MGVDTNYRAETVGEQWLFDVMGQKKGAQSVPL